MNVEDQIDLVQNNDRTPLVNLASMAGALESLCGKQESVASVGLLFFAAEMRKHLLRERMAWLATVEREAMLRDRFRCVVDVDNAEAMQSMGVWYGWSESVLS